MSSEVLNTLTSYIFPGLLLLRKQFFKSLENHAKLLVILGFHSLIFLLFSTMESMATPCSVTAIDQHLLPDVEFN